MVGKTCYDLPIMNIDFAIDEAWEIMSCEKIAGRPLYRLLKKRGGVSDSPESLRDEDLEWCEHSKVKNFSPHQIRMIMNLNLRGLLTSVHLLRHVRALLAADAARNADKTKTETAIASFARRIKAAQPNLVSKSKFIFLIGAALRSLTLAPSFPRHALA